MFIFSPPQSVRSPKIVGIIRLTQDALITSLSKEGLARAWCIQERARKGLPAVQGFARTPAGFFPRPLRKRFESVWVKPSPPFY